MINVIPIRLNDVNALRIVRDLAAKSANVYVTSHARVRMLQRNITGILRREDIYLSLY